ncbi:MAG TPA: response regulator, partial [Candidatus Binataceae bacterium]|nr:response regulator [Candidatus Binataceae bacterium]
SIRLGVKKVQAIVRRLDEMARTGKYVTVDYLKGKRMADLTPREAAPEAASLSNGPPRAEGEWPLAGMTMVVLDDDVSVVNSLADLMRAERCVVYTATRPSAALGLIRNVRVDVVLSDVVMPEMDGYEFYLRVKEEFPNLPCVLMTAYYYDKDHIIKRSKLRGLEGAIFKKPVNPDKLRQLLCAMRQKKQTAPIAAASA